MALCTSNESGQKVAIKRMNGLFSDGLHCKRILREITFLRLFRHPSIVNMIEILMPTDPKNFDTIYVVLEHITSDLSKVTKSSMQLKLHHIKMIIYNLLCAVKYMHDCKVIHRDIKSANILIEENCQIRLCDFGLSRYMGQLSSSSDIILRKKIKEDSNENSQNSTEGSTADIVLSGANSPEERTTVSKILKETKNERKNITRELSEHVVTR